MHIHSLRIKDLRCFESAEVQLQHPGREESATLQLPNVNLLLGNNGVGKTTVLRAIALAVLSPILGSSGFSPYCLVRRRQDSSEARVEADLVLHREDLADRWRVKSESYSIAATIQRIGTQERLQEEERGVDDVFRTLYQLFNDQSPGYFLVGYGSSRYALDASSFEPTPLQRKRRALRYQRVAGLFEDFVSLTPLSSWLPRLWHENSSRAAEVVEIFSNLLPDEARFTNERGEDDEYVFSYRGIPVPLGALSDGYRAYIAWLSDLLYNMTLGASEGTPLRKARGVVLVDEIDLHLHPEWQREVVPTVARTLPNLQFVFTTHSPIVAGTLAAQNIFVLEMDDSGASSVRQLEEPIHGLNADQILVSSYFGLDTTRAPSAVADLNELSRKAMSGDSEAALAFLRTIASGTELSPSGKPKKSKKTPTVARRSRRTRAK